EAASTGDEHAAQPADERPLVWGGLLDQLGEGLALAEQWLTAPALIPATPATRRSLTGDELTTLSASELRRSLNQMLGRLADLTGERIPFLQMQANDAMGVNKRADDDEEQ